MSANGHRRVVITGLGAVTPLGNDAETSWKELIEGRSGAGPITAFDADGYTTTFACELKNFEPASWMDYKQARRMDRFAQMIVAAGRQATEDSGLSIEAEPDRIGVSAATGMGGLKAYQDVCDTLIERGPPRVSPFSVAAISIREGADQSCSTFCPFLEPMKRRSPPARLTIARGAVCGCAVREPNV